MFCRQGLLFIVSSAQRSHPYNLFRAYFAHYPPSKHRFHACVGLQKPLENLFRFRLKRAISPRTPSDWKIQPKILSVDFFKSGWTNGRLEVAGIRIRDFREGSSFSPNDFRQKRCPMCIFARTRPRFVFHAMFSLKRISAAAVSPVCGVFSPVYGVYCSHWKDNMKAFSHRFRLKRKPAGGNSRQNHKGWLFFSRLNCGHKKMHV